MHRMMNRWMKRQNPQQKRDMMAMMSQLMESMGSGDMMENYLDSFTLYLN